MERLGEQYEEKRRELEKFENSQIGVIYEESARLSGEEEMMRERVGERVGRKEEEEQSKVYVHVETFEEDEIRKSVIKVKSSLEAGSTKEEKMFELRRIYEEQKKELVQRL